MTADEVKDALEAAHDKVELRDPDHLYVPGRVILMHQDWEVSLDSNASKDIDNEGKQGMQRCTISDGTSTVLRFFEIDGYSMLGDHTTASYESRIDALLPSSQHECDNIESAESQTSSDTESI